MRRENGGCRPGIFQSSGCRVCESSEEMESLWQPQKYWERQERAVGRLAPAVGGGAAQLCSYYTKVKYNGDKMGPCTASRRSLVTLPIMVSEKRQ